MLPTIAREADAVVMIDQRKLPAREQYVRCKTAPEVARAIKTMVIRGAPAIGVAAAMGIALGMRKSKETGTKNFAAEFHKTCELMASTRPTKVDLVVVGAARIAANGDTANKIGTYTVAVLAREHAIPFYVAAPLSTIDLDTPDGDHIPIEERNPREVTHVGSSQLAPKGALIW